LCRLRPPPGRARSCACACDAGTAGAARGPALAGACAGAGSRATPAPPPTPAFASLATLQDIHAQRNPRRLVDMSVSRPSMRIGKDALELTVRSSHDGHVYLVMVGSDAKSFYVLFPNGLDGDNRIQGQPAASAAAAGLEAHGPGPGGHEPPARGVPTRRATSRRCASSRRRAAAPFTFSLNDLPGRSALFDFIAGRGITGSSDLGQGCCLSRR
jgi:hypothetical protein